MLKIVKLTCLPNLVSLAQWEQVSPHYYSYYSYYTTPTIRARLAGPARLRKIPYFVFLIPFMRKKNSEKLLHYKKLNFFTLEIY